jgi:hypothetical protein
MSACDNTSVYVSTILLVLGVRAYAQTDHLARDIT